MPPNKDFFTFYWAKLVFNKICKIQFFGGERGWNLVLFTESPRLWYAAGASPLSPAKYPTIILTKKLFNLKWRCPLHVIICIFLLEIISSENQLVFNIWNRWDTVQFWFSKFFPQTLREQWALDRRSPIQKWPINTATVDTQIDWNSHKIQVFSSLQPNFGTSWKVAWVLYSERCVRVLVTEKFWKNLKLSKYFNKSAPCHTSLPDQLNLDRHSLRPVSKSLENALSSLGFTRTKDNFRNSYSLNYYHIVFFWNNEQEK